MDNVDKSRKLGFGIVFLGVINLIIFGIGLLGNIRAIIDPSSLDIINEYYSKLNMTTLSMTNVIISTVLGAVILISVILILSKKSLGAYLFIAGIILNYIYNVIIYGFTISSLLGLILPVIMIILLFRKKEIFFR